MSLFPCNAMNETVCMLTYNAFIEAFSSMFLYRRLLLTAKSVYQFKIFT